MDLEYRHKDGRIFRFAALVKDYGFTGLILCNGKVIRKFAEIHETEEDAICEAFQAARSL